MTEIEVNWEIKPKSGLTYVELSDLKCKTKKEWKSLNNEEQKKRLSNALIEIDLPSVQIIPTDWEGDEK